MFETSVISNYVAVAVAIRLYWTNNIFIYLFIYLCFLFQFAHISYLQMPLNNASVRSGSFPRCRDFCGFWPVSHRKLSLSLVMRNKRFVCQYLHYKGRRMEVVIRIYHLFYNECPTHQSTFSLKENWWLKSKTDKKNKIHICKRIRDYLFALT